MRQSSNQYIDNILFNGYDYKNQCWVLGGVYVECNHPATMDCYCYAREHGGEKCTINSKDARG